jgi:hypothetical protein
MNNVRETYQDRANQEELDRLTEVASSAAAVAVRLRELDRPFAAYLAELLICELTKQVDESRALTVQWECTSKGICGPN